MSRTGLLSKTDPRMISSIKRCGVIFYTLTKSDKKLCFCFGNHSNTNELTDFGGSKKYTSKSLYEGTIACAEREAKEETLNVFINYEIVQNSNTPYICNNNIIIFFLYLDEDELFSGVEKFKNIREEKQKILGMLEVDNLIVLNYEQLCDVLIKDNIKIYDIVKNLITEMFQDIIRLINNNLDKMEK